MFALLLPVIVLSMLFPVPSMAEAPVRVRFSTWTLLIVYVTLLSTVSVPPPPDSVTVSPASSTT